MLSEYVESDLDLGGMGRLLALTPNDEANALACQHFAEEFGSAEVFQLPPDLSPRTGDAPNQPRLGRMLFGPDATFVNLLGRLEGGAVFKATQLTDKYTSDGYEREQGGRTLPLLAVRQGRLSVGDRRTVHSGRQRGAS